MSLSLHAPVPVARLRVAPTWRRRMMRVAWCSSWTGEMGHGDPLPARLAVRWRDYGNEHYPDFLHWVEEV